MQRPQPTRPLEVGAETFEPMATCPDDEALLSLAMGELTGTEHQLIEEHVRDCSDCREILSEALRSLGGEATPSEGFGGAKRILLDRYELQEPIGSGGAGVVYRSYDLSLKRVVAVKILRPDLPGARDGFQKRLRREAQATAQLSHPNVVTAHDFGSTESGGFIVLEYFSGGTLENWLHGEHSLEERLRVMCEAGRGLAAAHDKGLVHRDFKPQNVLLSEDGRVCVTDFGLARLEEVGDRRGFQADATIGNATETRGLMGTPSYMAPEIFGGLRGDEASDQFSFSVALYQAVCGRHPFRGSADTTLAELLTRMKSGLIDPVGLGVPEHVSRVITRGLAAEPTMRFPSMNELLAALENKPRSFRSLRVLSLSTTTLLALGLTLSAFISRSGPERPLETIKKDVEPIESAQSNPKKDRRTAQKEEPTQPKPQPVETEQKELIAPPSPQPAATTRTSAKKKPVKKTGQASATSKTAPTPTSQPPKSQARFDNELRDPF